MIRRPHIFIPIFLFLLLTSCGKLGCKHDVTLDADAYIDDGREKHAQLEYIEDFYDFGTIKQGETVSYTFSFTNSGNIPLVVKDVVVGCGCTKPKVSKEIIKPKEVATMEVVFDSKGWHGIQYKAVTIHTNGITPRKSVTIKANVID